MGSVGAKKSLYEIYTENHVGYKSTLDKEFRAGNITKEQRDAAFSTINNGMQQILERMVDNFTEQNIKALISTMDRKFALTSDSDITGAITLYKTANGFVLDAPSTRSHFRAFMDNDGNLRRLPANEMDTAQDLRLSGSHKLYLSRKFEDISRRRR